MHLLYTVDQRMIAFKTTLSICPESVLERHEHCSRKRSLSGPIVWTAEDNYSITMVVNKTTLKIAQQCMTTNRIPIAHQNTPRIKRLTSALSMDETNRRCAHVCSCFRQHVHLSRFSVEHHQLIYPQQTTYARHLSRSCFHGI